MSRKLSQQVQKKCTFYLLSKAYIQDKDYASGLVESSIFYPKKLNEKKLHSRNIPLNAKKKLMKVQ